MQNLELLEEINQLQDEIYMLGCQEQSEITDSYIAYDKLTQTRLYQEREKMTMLEKIKKELTKRFEENNMEPITIVMRNSNHQLTITAYAQCSDLKSVKDAEFFSIDGSPTMPYLSGNNIEEVAMAIKEYDTLLKCAKDDADNCDAFYNKRIKGHSVEEKELGFTIYEANSSEYSKNREDGEDMLEYLIRVGCTTDIEKSAVELMFALETYSDWYKSNHGFRPRNLAVNGIYM